MARRPDGAASVRTLRPFATSTAFWPYVLPCCTRIEIDNQPFWEEHLVRRPGPAMGGPLYVFATRYSTRRGRHRRTDGVL
ncbi:hypothetical protein [Robbsia andropogonis]|uniref:hypothetical protein n=1 Tax=Robbsia andropogonis TaxID=28092 RepID=UPI00138DD2E8